MLTKPLEIRKLEREETLRPTPFSKIVAFANKKLQKL
jgi:hypothetical protein